MVFLLTVDHEYFIGKTLSLARRAEGNTSPNPLVGALLVKQGRIISEGYHKKAGTPHAEVIAIDKAGKDAAGATLYVSLEPCCHKDKRTPPCTEKIMSSGIRDVVIAMKDPNPKVSGKGIEELRKAGIRVISGVLEAKAKKLNESYIKYMTTGLPFVTLKVAMTMDGKIATPEGESKWITGDKARAEVHRLRSKADAVMTAIGTVKADDPLLTCRNGRGRSPVRVVIDPNLEISPDARVLTCPPRTYVVTRTARSRSKKDMLREKGVQIIEYHGQRLDLVGLIKELGQAGMISILVEGGASLNSYCLEAGIVDKVVFFIAPKIIGGRESFSAVGGKRFRRLHEAHMISDITVKRLGDDIMIEGYVLQ
jgi:diaminohydroxyphosphoribosylaminopyrimidine deaminase/5-amino-6-(5-phosphoribosylamino)uracil reductase